MALANVKKAAMLLTALDSASAAELLKSAPPDTLTEIAAELAYIHQGGQTTADPRAMAEPIREFFSLMHRRPEQGSFLEVVLDNALGRGRSQEVLTRIAPLVEARDPFRPIRAAAIEDLGKALEGESAQVAALVLSELPSRNATALLPLLPEAVRFEAVRGMTAGLEVAIEVRFRVAAGIRKRLEGMRQKGQPVVTGGGATAPQKRRQQLRKVALLLRGLETGFRNTLLESIRAQDKETAEAVQKLMVTWEDMPLVGDRSMQEILRTVESKNLALAMVGAEQAVSQKIRENISERAAQMLEEEMSLLNKPKAEVIAAARESILEALRTLNAKGELPLEGN